MRSRIFILFLHFQQGGGGAVPVCSQLDGKGVSLHRSRNVVISKKVIDVGLRYVRGK